MSELGIPIIYSRIIISAVGSHTAELLDVVSPTPGSGETGFMSIAQYRALLRRVIEISGDPLIALRAGANIPFSVHGPLGIATMSSPTLGQALQAINRYAFLRSPFCRTELLEEDGHRIFTLNIDEEMQAEAEPALDFMLSTIGHSIHNAVAEPLRLPHVELMRSRPGFADRYGRILGYPVRYSQPRNALVLDARDMTIPLLGENAEEYAKAMERLSKIMHMLRQASSMTDAVISSFTRNTGHLCSLTETARTLNVSPRSLQRKLSDEGACFQALRDQWLGQQAAQLLLRESLPVDVTATLLGFSETANFRRLFKRQFGMPPAEYRKRQLRNH